VSTPPPKPGAQPGDARAPVAERDPWAWLQGLRPRGIELGLDRVRQALARLGDPQAGLTAVTVAGTNGKGSTASLLASVVHAAGYRVGLYTSPHLVHVSERIRVGGHPISHRDLARWAGRVRDVTEGRDGVPGIPLTFFEALTVMALGYFAERDVDLAVLEVGLGGRLDATAVVPPRVAVLTPIGLDHQAVLGDRIEDIAAEKAGIIQPGATVVTGVSEALFREVVGPRAFALRCPIRRVGVDFLWRWLPGGFRYRGWIHRLGPVRLGLRGVHQGGNAALACAAAEALAAHGFHFSAPQMAEGLARARHPGRLERREPRVGDDGRPWPATLLDGAHNAMGARTLARQVAGYLPERPRVLVFAARPDKDHAALLGALVPTVDAVVVTSVPGGGMAPPDALAAVARQVGASEVLVEEDPQGALGVARSLAGADGGILVAGSLYLVGAVLPHV